jgi:hypothetical protein
MAGSEEELELVACGERLVGRWVGVWEPVVEFVGEGLFDDLRLEPTSLLKPAFMDDIDEGKKGRGGGQAGCTLLNVRLDAGHVARLRGRRGNTGHVPLATTPPAQMGPPA